MSSSTTKQTAKFEGLEKDDFDDIYSTIHQISGYIKDVDTRKKSKRSSVNSEQKLATELSTLIETVEQFHLLLSPTNTAGVHSEGEAE